MNYGSTILIIIHNSSFDIHIKSNRAGNHRYCFFSCIQLLLLVKREIFLRTAGAKSHYSLTSLRKDTSLSIAKYAMEPVDKSLTLIL